ncbi:MAG TPA: XRE family transcriptional regulator [Streptosporangiaceae bacterium]|nr:XRE family transcriptional regulator [Streptosporangiaceae bacterium]
MSSIPPVGQRIREVRLQRGLTLRGLARAVGVSASLVSQIETGKSQPSVSTLYAITKALDISVEDVFDTNGGTGALPAAATMPPAAEAVAADAAAAARPPAPRVTAASAGTEGVAPDPAGDASPEPTFGTPAASGTAAEAEADAEVRTEGAERRVGPIVRADRREVLELDSGVTWERLGRVPGTPVDFLLVTYAPGGTSSGTGLLMRHSGVEYGYLLSGELTLTLGFDEYRLRPGDAVSFPSTTPHRYHNDGDQPAVGVWFVDDSTAGLH